MVFQNTLLACQQLNSSLCLKFFQDFILEFYTVRPEDFRASAYRESKEESALL